MAIRYHFDLYPRDNPKNGIRLVRFTKLQSAEYRGEANGTGAGRFSLRGDTTDAGFIDPRGLQYVRVVRLGDAVTLALSAAADDIIDTAAAHGLVVGNTIEFITLTGGTGLSLTPVYYVKTVPSTSSLTLSATRGGATVNFTTDVTAGTIRKLTTVGGFFLDNGDFSALDEKGTRLLTFGGAGTLSYLAREVLWSRPYFYAADVPIIDSTWHFYNQPSIVGGDFLGAVLYRVMLEARSFASPVVEVDDKPETAIPDASTGPSLSALNDSAGNAWTVPSGEFKAQVGDGILTIVKRLMEAGLYIEMNPDTFVLNAWEQVAWPGQTTGSRGQDKSGAAWGLVGGVGATYIVRFQAPTDGTIATGNVLSDAKRGVAAFTPRSAMLAGDNGTYVVETVASTVPWHGYYPNDSQDVATLSHIADSQIGARSDAGDTLRLRMKHGTDAANGEYIPLSDYDQAGVEPSGVVMLNDLVTVHTGTGQWDYNEDTFPVAALTVTLRPGGDWDAWADLGSSYTSMAERAFQARGVATHTHPPNPRLCPYDAGLIAMDSGWRVLNAAPASVPGWTAVGFDDSAWAAPTLHDPGANYPIRLAGDGTLIPSDETLLRKEYYIEPEDLVGAAVALRYALDNAGSVYVNGVAVATLGPNFTNTTGHWNTDHATTIARSAFRAGYNCIAIYVNNDAAGSPGATPPGAIAGGVEIDIGTTNGNGTSKYAARCDKHYHASDIDENTYGNVQAAIDALGTAAVDDSAELARAIHGRFLATYHRASDNYPMLMSSDDGVTFSDIGVIRAENRRDPSLIHFDGAYWMLGTGGTTSFGVYRATDPLALPWGAAVATVSVDGAATNTWAPEWVRNLDGTPYLHPSTGFPVATVNVSTDSETTFTVREIHPTNRGMTSWSAATTITGTSFPTKMIDAYLLADSDAFYLWFKDEVAKHIEIAQSSSLTSGYTLLESGDWAGWFAAKDAGANSIEGPCVIRLDDGRWRIYFNENNGFSSIRAVYSETTDDWRTGTSTWTTQAVITTDALMSHGSVIYIPGMYDHQRDPDAHGGAAPIGAAGGDLSGTYPNPSVVDDSHAHSAATAPGTVGIGALLLASDHATPIVFDDILQSSDGSDFIYASEP